MFRGLSPELQALLSLEVKHHDWHCGQGKTAFLTGRMKDERRLDGSRERKKGKKAEKEGEIKTE